MIRRTLLLLVLVSLPAWAALDTVTDFFEQARYEEARQALDQAGGGFRAGEATLWAAQLATRPDQALVLLREGLTDQRIPSTVRRRMALEIANIEFGLGRYQSSLKALTPLLDETELLLEGQVHLRAGLALRALGNSQKAREMLASVKPQDPSFFLARYYLGDIALEQNDPGLALRYFDSAVTGGGPDARVAGGKWRAFQAQGRDQDAADLADNLGREDPGSLAMLEISRLRRAQQEELEAMATVEPAGEEGAVQPGNRGRYALQLGAFSDRSLALEFLKRHRDQLPDLRIDQVRDQRGQFLYKVRTGSFVNPALARTEARKLGNELNMEVIVADLSDTDHRSD